MIIFGGSLFKSMALRRGGLYIGRKSGGRRENPATSDPDEKIHQCGGRIPLPPASGVRWPMCWKTNVGINAFAAGYTPDDAVVAVTDGCLRLTRDELRGVAHEFSHNPER
ncbi:MAG: M48 family metalloprotease [Desulfobacterales bacterium]